MAFQMENLFTGQRRTVIQYYFAEGRKPPEINLSGSRIKKKVVLNGRCRYLRLLVAGEFYEHPQLAITTPIIPQRSEEVGQSNVASSKNKH